MRDARSRQDSSSLNSSFLQRKQRSGLLFLSLFRPAGNGGATTKLSGSKAKVEKRFYPLP
jgi:hypothetical protein